MFFSSIVFIEIFTNLYILVLYHRFFQISIAFIKKVEKKREKFKKIANFSCKKSLYGVK